MRSRRVGSFVALTLALALAALGPTVQPVTAQSAPDAPTTAPAPSALVRIPFPQDDGTLTPYTFDLGYPLVSLVYDTLMWRDADGIPKPWLAESVDTSADGRHVTVHLAPGAHWQDGQDVTSADVAFTFDYVAAHPHPWFTPELSDVVKVATPDPLTAVIDLREPAAGFLDQPLSDVPILPRHLWVDLPPGTVAPAGPPVGSGPYRLTEYKPGVSYRFDSFDGYFRGPPSAKEIFVPIQGDAAKTVDLLTQGQIDMVPVSLSAAEADRFRRAGIRVAKGPSYDSVDLVFNTRRAPFDNPAARKAVSSALDLARLTTIVKDGTSGAGGLLHPASPWAPGGDLYRFDGEGSRKALAALRLPTVVVVAPDVDASMVESARQVAFALTRAGVTAEARKLSRADYETVLGEGGSEPVFQLAIWRSPPFASYDPDFLRRMFGSDSATARLNFSGYASPTFDALADRIANTVDVPKRKALVGEALRLLADEAPVVPLFFPNGEFAYRAKAHNRWVFVKGTGIFDKRSFVGPLPVPEPEPTSTPRRADAAASVPAPSGGSRFPYWIPAVVFFGGAGLLAVYGLRRRDR